PQNSAQIAVVPRLPPMCKPRFLLPNAITQGAPLVKFNACSKWQGPCPTIACRARQFTAYCNTMAYHASVAQPVNRKKSAALLLLVLGLFGTGMSCMALAYL